MSDCFQSLDDEEVIDAGKEREGDANAQEDIENTLELCWNCVSDCATVEAGVNVNASGVCKTNIRASALRAHSSMVRTVMEECRDVPERFRVSIGPLAHSTMTTLVEFVEHVDASWEPSRQRVDSRDLDSLFVSSADERVKRICKSCSLETARELLCVADHLDCPALLQAMSITFASFIVDMDAHRVCCALAEFVPIHSDLATSTAETDNTTGDTERASEHVKGSGADASAPIGIGSKRSHSNMQDTCLANPTTRLDERRGRRRSTSTRANASRSWETRQVDKIQRLLVGSGGIGSGHIH